MLYFTYDPRSDYSYIADDSDRLEEVCASNGLHTPIFNELEKQCIELYKKLTTTTSLELLKSTKTAVGKVRQFLETADTTISEGLDGGREGCVKGDNRARKSKGWKF